MMSPGGKLTAFAFHLTKKVKKAEEITYLPTNNAIYWVKYPLNKNVFYKGVRSFLDLRMGASLDRRRARSCVKSPSRSCNFLRS
jgi:hypothetical protein